MRIALTAAILAVSTTFAPAAFYVIQDVQTGKCFIEQELPASTEKQVLLKNQFADRSDAEAALKDVPACN